MRGPESLPTYDDALAAVLAAAASRVRTGRVPLPEACGLALAEDVRADRDLPPFHRATLDGYAVAADDPAVRAGEPLAVGETLAAGQVPRRALRRGTAALVMTGAPAPRGADAVVRREDARLLDGGRFVVLPPPRPGEGVHVRGCDGRRGAVVLRRGTVLTPRTVAVLAAVGRVRPPVHAPPRVAVVVTGDEIAPASARRVGPAAIRNSNGPMLEALAAAAGGRVVHAGSARDDARSLAAAVRRALAVADVVLLSGGVSAGDRDLVPEVLAAAGVRRALHGIALRPGKPLWFGTRRRALVFGLPGNPVSAHVTFTLLVAPALARLRGVDDAAPRFQGGRLGAGVGPAGRREAFLPARVEGVGADGLPRVRLVPWNGSGDFVGFAAADALLRRAAGAPAADEGEVVTFLPLGDGGR